MRIEELKTLLEQHQIRPTKAKGQNFLINDQVLDKIIKAADLKADDQVLEIGPGFGVLTERLLEKVSQVLVVELDLKLAKFLKYKFKKQANFQLLNQDILRIKNLELQQKFALAKKYKLVANLPYAITKPVLRKFLTYDPKPEEIIVLVQKEVAQKIVAKKGKLNILGLTVQFYGRPQIIDFVSQQSFYPQPKVESAILKIKIYQSNIAPEVEKQLKDKNSFEEKKFWQLVKIGFSSPRKQLKNNIVAGLQLKPEEVKENLKELGLKEDIRAQDLDLKDWANLHQKIMVVD